jgi:hypothetical protein
MSKSRVANPVNNAEVLLSTHRQSEAHQLQPFEGRVMALKKPLNKPNNPPAANATAALQES